jgi:hypothetical protein
MDGENKGHILKHAVHLTSLTAALLLCTSVAAPAKVFIRSNGAAGTTRALESKGGKRIYESTLQINGGKASLSVFSFDKAISQVNDDLKTAIGADIPPSGAMGMTTIKKDGNVTRVIVLALDPHATTLVFKIDQTEEEYTASNKPSQQQIKDVPSFPGSSQSFFAKDENTSTTLSISTANTVPTDVHTFYGATLTAAGWKQLPPTSVAAGMVIFAKGDSICCLMADRAPGSGECRITLLHKQTKME